VAELTTLVEEVASLRLREAKARRDAEDAEKSFEELSERARWDKDEAARVWKERDELLQRDAETRQRILDLLAEVEKERELKLGAKERFADLQQRVNQDAKAVTWLCRERNELCQTSKRLCSECGASHGERD